uniref:Enoyl-CoA hydratase 1 n=1 Tax=Aquila chrysaetos chrysaetos TaxID=223781 RepID=A0A663FDB2_AQUCH
MAAGLRGLLGRSLQVPARLMSAEAAERRSPGRSFETLRVTPERDHVLHVELHRPEKRNAMNVAFWREMVECFQDISQDTSCRAVVISGAGKIFTAGIDLMEMGSDFLMVEGEDMARKAWNLRRKICEYQETFSVLEKCPKPVIAAVHGACIGAGIDLISACDIRYCTQDAWFQVKPRQRTGLHRPQDDGPRSAELRLGEPGFCRQGDAAAGSLGSGRHHRGSEPRGRAGHQGEPDLLAGPPRLRGPPLCGHLEHEHAADRGHPQVGAGGDGEEGSRGHPLLQAVGPPRPPPDNKSGCPHVPLSFLVFGQRGEGRD